MGRVYEICGYKKPGGINTVYGNGTVCDRVQVTEAQHGPYSGNEERDLAV